MADSLGEAFVRVIADTSTFGETLSSGVSDALSDASADVQDALAGVSGAAEEAFGAAAASADSAGGDISEAFDAAAGDAQEALDSVDATGLADRIRDNLGKIALGGAAAGAGLEVFARRERDAQVEARQLARATGMTEREMLDLIAATSDATFPLEDVTGLMRIGAQRGLEGADALAEFASFWDTVGDATGESAVELGKAAVALGQVGIGAGEESEALDALGFIMDNTTIETSKFLRFVGRVGTELGENTPSIDEMAGALGALEDAGLDVRVAQSELQQALRESDGDLIEALETLGISEEAYRAQVDAVEGSGDAIRGNADIFAAARTPVERMTQAVREQIFRFPMLGEAAGALAGPLTALGPAAMGFTHGAQAIQMVSGGVGKALGAMRATFVKLGAVILANPIFLIGALLIGVALLIWKFRDEIIDALVGAWDWIKEKTAALWEWLKGAFKAGVDAVVNFVTGLRDRVVDAFRRLVDGIRNLVQRWWDWYRGVWQRIFDLVRGIVNRIRDAVVGGFQRLVDGARDRLTALVDFVRGIPRMVLDALGNVGRMLLDAGRGIIQGLWDGMRAMWDNVTGWIGGLGDRIRNLKGPLSYDRVMLEDIGEAIIGGLGRGMQEEWKDVSKQLATLNTEIPMTLNPQMTGAVGQLTAFAGTPTRGVEIQMTINNPAPEPASTSATREMRKLSALGVFDA